MGEGTCSPEVSQGSDHQTTLGIQVSAEGAAVPGTNSTAVSTGEPDLAHLLVPLREADPPEIDSTAAPPTTRTTRRRITKEELGQVRRGVLPRP